MPVTYTQEAHDLCEKLWLKHGGTNHDLIEVAMQKVYPGWKKKNLYDSGKGKTARLGWITKDGLERKLKIHLEASVERVNSEEVQFYIEVKEFRKLAHDRAKAEDWKRDDVSIYRDFCKLTIDARKALDLSQDNLETFAACLENLTIWLGPIDPVAAKMLAKNGDRLMEMAEAHYGKAEIEYDGASGPEDEGGNEPSGPER